MGDKLASTIGVRLGSEIVLLTQAADGSMGNDVYTVVGIFHTGLDAMDRGLVLMPLSSLQELLQLPPGRIHEIGIKLNDITAATTVAAALQTRLAKIVPVTGDGVAGAGAGTGQLMCSSIAASLLCSFSFSSCWRSSAS